MCIVASIWARSSGYGNEPGWYAHAGSSAYRSPVLAYARAREPPQAVRNSHAPHLPCSRPVSRTPVKTGEPTVDAAEHSPAVFSVPETLAAGVYTVSWRAMGDDGHATSGKYSFTLR